MKKLKKDIMNLTSAGILTGVGANVVTGVGGNASGLAALSSSYPTIGTLSGAGAAMRVLSGMTKHKRKKKR